MLSVKILSYGPLNSATHIFTRLERLLTISDRGRIAGVCCPNQGRSQPHSSGWARVPLSSFFLKLWSIFLIFPQTLLIFFPHFGSPGGRVAHPGRLWLRHWSKPNQEPPFRDMQNIDQLPIS